MMSFGENLQLIRKKNQLSQEGLAEMLGVSRQAVSKWELGEGYPEVDKLLLLSKKLNVSIDSLLGGENTTAVSEKGKPSAAIRIISPHEEGNSLPAVYGRQKQPQIRIVCIRRERLVLVGSAEHVPCVVQKPGRRYKRDR